MNIIQQLHSTFNQIFPKQLQQKCFFSPGRINLIGEHIDYNGGYVFPCSIDLGTYAIVSPRSDNKFAVYSMNFPDTDIVEFDVNLITYDKNKQWVNYPKGVIKTIIDYGYKISHGLNICYYGNLPNGAGLSSSASIEILSATILNSYFALGINDINLIKYAQEAENKFVGVPCGIMDQFAIANGRKNQAIFLNCDTLNYQYAPINLGEYAIVIANSNKKRTLADSKYHQRFNECRTALKELQSKLKINHLCDIDLPTLEKNAQLISNAIYYKRAFHAVSENTRTQNALKQLKDNNLIEFCNLLKASHLSLKDNYNVTGIELDTLAETAWNFEYCIGARMTGAGFGGCTINVVKHNKVHQFIDFVGSKYSQKIGIIPSFYTVNISDGCKEIAL